MPVRRFKPTSPGRRTMTVSDFKEVTKSKSKPERSLTEKLTKKGGRNNNGRITTRHQGGGHKRRYRVIDFKRAKDGIPAKVAAVEYARDGIRVNCVCPGTFLSGIHADLSEEAIDAIAAKHPLGLGNAADLVGAYSYLASDASRWTTGSALVVDGGYSAP